MFVTISTYKAKRGEEDAIIALHEDWQRSQQTDRKSYLSGELLRSVKDTRKFIAILHFESQEAVQALTNDPEWKAWNQRLVSLTEHGPGLAEYTREWSHPTKTQVSG
jgi:heme-degrading monooxygenase HmoA